MVTILKPGILYLLRAMATRYWVVFGVAFAVALVLGLPNMTASHANERIKLAGALKPVIVQDDMEPETASPPPRANEDYLARRTIERESFYDPANPDLDKLQRLQEVTRGLPFDNNGFPDWMRALKEGRINPRTSLNGQSKMQILDTDVIMRNTKEMPNVRFPHRSHTLWLDCSNCHPSPFKPEAGSNAIRMADIFRGEFCGKCHDRVAFITFFSCSRCHSVPQDSGSGAK